MPQGVLRMRSVIFALMGVKRHFRHSRQARKILLFMNESENVAIYNTGAIKVSLTRVSLKRPCIVRNLTSRGVK